MDEASMMTPGSPLEFPDDETNPYAPPLAEVGTRFQRVRADLVPFDVGSILGATWNLFKARMGPCLGVCWTAFGLIWGSQFLQQRVLESTLPGAADPVARFLVTAAIFLMSYLFTTWLTIGMNLALLAIARGARSAVPLVFSGGRYLLTTILAGIVLAFAVGLVVMLSILLVTIVGAVVGPRSTAYFVLLAVGCAAAAVAAIYVSVRLSQFQYVIINQGAGVIDSLQRSWVATEGGVGTLILVFAMGIVIYLAGFLACLVGIVFSAPLVSLMLAVTYLSLTGQPLGRGKAVPEPWDEDFDDRV